MVDQKQLENLPLNGRQFANLGVARAGHVALGYNSDPTKPGQLTVALNGGIGRNVNFLVDGGDNTDDTIGGALQNFNLESVQEFNIQTQQYKAEYGRSTGGVLTVVTKTGTNELRRQRLGLLPRRQPEREDRVREARRQRQAALRPQAVRRLARRPDRQGQGPLLRHLREDRPQDLLHRQHRRRPAGRRRPGSVAIPFKDELLTAKVTDDLVAQAVPAGPLRLPEEHATSTARARSPLPSSLGTITNKYSSILAGHTLADRRRQPQRVRLPVHQVQQPDHRRLQRSRTSTSRRARTAARTSTRRRRTNQTKYQYKDDFSFTRTLGGRANDFKAGFNYIHEPTLGGDFTTGTTGQYILAADNVELAGHRHHHLRRLLRRQARRSSSTAATSRTTAASATA